MGNAVQQEGPGTQKASKFFGNLRQMVKMEILHVLHKTLHLLICVK